MAALDLEIDRSRRELTEAWAAASSADRIFAVDRLLREDRMAPELYERLAALQALVRGAWVEVRVASLAGSTSTAARQAGLRLLLLEREVDELLDQGHLREALYLTAEGFLRRVPAPHGHSLRELARARERELERLVHFLPAQDVAS
ncbi:MAG: hypothetical protein A2138_12265 [Deltaproteobacteria bacterium RBG_16_71_12]|nr:MAG: hypothetical protein A2138_12265 [Deltaproteobacteria bacterium RBG_16_71_12]